MYSMIHTDTGDFALIATVKEGGSDYNFALRTSVDDEKTFSPWFILRNLHIPYDDKQREFE